MMFLLKVDVPVIKKKNYAKVIYVHRHKILVSLVNGKNVIFWEI